MDQWKSVRDNIVKKNNIALGNRKTRNPKEYRKLAKQNM